MQTANILITKANGQVVPFKKEKLEKSLLNAGASKQKAHEITTEVEGLLYSGMSTKKIYSHAFRLLKRHSLKTAARYKIKKAILELGPTGFPFEKLIGELFKEQGYAIQVGVFMHGKCIDHEVDVFAENAKEVHIVECKFHRDQGRKSNVQTPLYIKARFDDIVENTTAYSAWKHKKITKWVFTNTHFSEDAIIYGECASLHLVSWNYPLNNSLKDRITRSGLHPITCLSSITVKEKEALMENGVVLCKQLRENLEILLSKFVDKRRHSKVRREVEE